MNLIGVDKTYRFDLDEKEVLWLRAVMQNPLGGQSPDEEDEDTRSYRHNLFNILNDAIKNNIV